MNIFEAKELSGILNWCLDGLQKYYAEGGLNPPQIIKDETQQYRDASDKLGNFMNDCLIKSNSNISVNTAYKVYKKWCEENGRGVDGKGNFIAELKAKNLFSDSATVGGKTVKNAICDYTITQEWMSQISGY